MPTEAEYREKIQALDLSDLQDLWKRIEARDTKPDWEPGKAFEYLILRAFELEGAAVTYPFSVTLPFVGDATVELD